MRRKSSNASDNSLHIALFIIRVGFGIFYMIHGWPKIMGGADRWIRLGENMELIGLGFAPVVWGFMAALSEFGGGLLLVFGLLTRPAAALMLFTMLIAALMYIDQGEPINTVINPLKGLVVFAGLLICGGGRYSIDYSLFGRRR
jgi:putative oxidoreductase